MGLEDVSVRRTFEALAHLRYYVIALYKSAFTYLLTYIDNCVTDRQTDKLRQITN